jgi:hypothetical protein
MANGGFVLIASSLLIRYVYQSFTLQKLRSFITFQVFMLVDEAQNFEDGHFDLNLSTLILTIALLLHEHE